MNSSVPTVFASMDRQAKSCRVGRPERGAHAVLPVIAGHEIAARVADHGHPELSNKIQDVMAPAICVGGRMPGLVDPAVDRPTHVFHERAEEPIVDPPDGRGAGSMTTRASAKRRLGQIAGAFDQVDEAPHQLQPCTEGRSADELPTWMWTVPGSTTRR